MITILSALDTLIEIIKNSPLKNEITGGIYPLKRPDNSQVEDIVLLPIVQIDEVWSEGVINANIHVQDLHVSIKDKKTGKIFPQLQPNYNRLKELLELSKIHFEYLAGDSTNNPYQMILSSHNILEGTTEKGWFVNLRFSYQNYK